MDFPIKCFVCGGEECFSKLNGKVVCKFCGSEFCEVNRENSV